MKKKILKNPLSARPKPFFFCFFGPLKNLRKTRLCEQYGLNDAARWGDWTCWPFSWSSDGKINKTYICFIFFGRAIFGGDTFFMVIWILKKKWFPNWLQQVTGCQMPDSLVATSPGVGWSNYACAARDKRIMLDWKNICSCARIHPSQQCP